jgi:hypothetical protein
LLGKALLPSPHHRSADVQACRDPLHRPWLGRSEHDLRSLDMFLRPVAIGNDRLKCLPVRRTQNDAY